MRSPKGEIFVGLLINKDLNSEASAPIQPRQLFLTHLNTEWHNKSDKTGQPDKT